MFQMLFKKHELIRCIVYYNYSRDNMEAVPRCGQHAVAFSDRVCTQSTMGVRQGLLFCKLTLANLAIMLAPVKESDFCLMLFTEGF